MSTTLQPWKLQLLSIPKTYPQSIAGCTHAIVKNIFFPQSQETLFSFTQNALELSIVANVEVIANDFMSLHLEGMKVSEDVFCAFMVDDPDGIDNSGRRINELSALLSRNGVSIFYLSTRITDLILVKEKRLKLVLPTIRSIFSLSVDSDCDLSSSTRGEEYSDQGSFPGSSFTSMNSFLHTPSSPSSTRIQSFHYQYQPPQGGGSFSTAQFQYHQQQQQQQHNSLQQQSPSSAFYGSSFGNSFTNPSTGISIPFGRRSSSNYGHYASTSSMAIGAGRPGGRYRTRNQSDSDSSSIDGLRRYNGNTGTVSTSHSQSQLYQRSQHRRQSSIADSSFGDGIGRFFPKKYAQGSSVDSMDSMGHATAMIGEMPVPINSDNSLHLTLNALNKKAIAGGPNSAGSSTSFHSLTPSGSSFPAFGSMPSFMGLMQETLEEQEERESDIKEKIRRSCPRSVIDDKLMLAGLAPEYQAEWAVTLIKVLFYPDQLPGFSNNSKSRFISFTTTNEGTSLIADQEVLGHFEDHMLNMSSSETMLRCIQVDLSTFGLDTYGLVYSMSNPLVDHGVNLLCLSTFRTANVLVQDSDLEKSLKVLSLSG
ncbi:GATS protein-like 3 [Haplosporangium gracile]|nr:GATS protein-like 3 [Haplosporangium gracile]